MPNVKDIDITSNVYDALCEIEKWNCELDYFTDVDLEALEKLDAEHSSEHYDADGYDALGIIRLCVLGCIIITSISCLVINFYVTRGCFRFLLSCKAICLLSYCSFLVLSLTIPFHDSRIQDLTLDLSSSHKGLFQLISHLISNFIPYTL